MATVKSGQRQWYELISGATPQGLVGGAGRQAAPGGEIITPHRFRSFISKKGNQRFFLRSCQEFGTDVVFEEMPDDNEVLSLGGQDPRHGPVPSRKVVPPDFPDVVEVRRRLEANHTMESSKWRQSKVAKDNGMSSFPGRPRRGSLVGLVARQLRVVRSSHPTASGLSSARRETTGSSGVPAKSLEPTWCPKRCQMTTKSSLWEGKILAMVEPVD
ncbi:hypothetical protein HPB51_018017 [Rhipicephalus microplus]|uniref:DIX domain-containing protein n=1 Tax=Rhipicephalus microplus TaxID=6941 RepID=A0A9J6D606_RHIMP|nr:hypothetical protein HPB51_018017 [Rhipicephalus microplus]